MTGYTEALLSERGRPRPPPSNGSTIHLNSSPTFPFANYCTSLTRWGICSTGAAEDGRAPTEELACVGGGHGGPPLR